MQTEKSAPNVDHLTPFQAVKNELDPSLDLDIKMSDCNGIVDQKQPTFQQQTGCLHYHCLSQWQIRVLECLHQIPQPSM